MNLKDYKKHADFQSSYRRSFNFKHPLKNETFILNENGELVMVNKDKV